MIEYSYDLHALYSIEYVRILKRFEESDKLVNK